MRVTELPMLQEGDKQTASDFLDEMTALTSRYQMGMRQCLAID